MQLALAVADVVVGRSGAGTVCEQAALGIPAVYVPLPIGNGEQRLNAAAVVAAGGGLLVDDADLDPAWVRAHLPVLLVGDAAAETRERMGRAAAERRGPRTPPRAGRPAGRGGAAVTRPSCGPPTSAASTSSASAAPACPRSPRCSPPAAWRSAGPTPPTAPRCRRCATAGVDGARRPRRRARRRRRHRRDLVAPSASPTPSSPAPASAACGCCTGPRRSPSLMVDRDAVAVAGAHGKTTTSAMIATALLHAGADPSFAIGGTVFSADGPLGGGRDGAGRGVRRGGRRVRRLVPRVRAAGRGRDQRRAGPPRPLRLRGGVRGRVRRSSPAASGPAARSSPAPTTPVRRGWSTACATRSRRGTSPSSPTARRRTPTSGVGDLRADGRAGGRSTLDRRRPCTHHGPPRASRARTTR